MTNRSREGARPGRPRPRKNLTTGTAGPAGLAPASTPDQHVAHSRSSDTATGNRQGCCCWCHAQRTHLSWSLRRTRPHWRRPRSPALAGGRPQRPEGFPGAASRALCPAASHVTVGGASWGPGRPHGVCSCKQGTAAGQARLDTGAPGGFGDHTWTAPRSGASGVEARPLCGYADRGRPEGGARREEGASWEQDRCPGEQSVRPPSRSASSPPRPWTQRWRPHSLGEKREPSVQCLARCHLLRPCQSVTRAGTENTGTGSPATASPPHSLPPSGLGGRVGGGPGPPALQTAHLPGCPHPAQDPRRPHVGFRDQGPLLPQAGSAQGPAAPVSPGAGLFGCPRVPSPPSGRVEVRVETAG